MAGAPLVGAPPSPEAVPMRIPLLLLLGGVLLSPLGAESQEKLYQEIELALGKDFFPKALQLIKQGMEDYPDDFRFPQIQGDLFARQELYDLALRSYRLAERINPQSLELRYGIANTLSLLDRNLEAIGYLEDLIGYKDSVLFDLGWLYYKTHQAERGVEVLLPYWEKSFDKYLAHQLGSLYSKMKNPALSRRYYLEAIESAVREGFDKGFIATTYYNLSLAERSFYNYQEAYEYAQASLSYRKDAGGYRLLGRLYTESLDFEKALKTLGQSLTLDQTPLTRLILVELYLTMGQPTKALEEVKAIQGMGRADWLYRYGVTNEGFDAMIYRLLFKSYEGLYAKGKIQKEWTFQERIQRWKGLALSKIKGRYYQEKFKAAARQEGVLTLQGGSDADGSLLLAEAYESFGSLAGNYYKRARVDLPAAQGWYDLAEGRVRGDGDQIRQALQELDPRWEALFIEEARRELSLSSRDQREKDRFLRLIYQANPGGLLSYGLSLPVELYLKGADPWMGRKIRSFLKGSGFALREAGSGAHTLTIDLERGLYSLAAPGGGVLYTGPISPSPQGVLSWITSFREEVFTP